MVLRGDRTPGTWVGRTLYRLSTGDEVEPIRAALDEADREVGELAVVGAGSTPSVEALGTVPDVVLSRDGPTGESSGVAGAPSAVPIRAGSLDAVVVPALHAAGPLDGLFEEAARVLRPGGVLVVRGADPSTLPGRTLRAVEHLLGREATFLAPVEVVARAEGAGLTPVVIDDGWRYAVACVGPGGSARS